MVNVTVELRLCRVRWLVFVAWLLCSSLTSAGEYTLTEQRAPQRLVENFTLYRDLEENLNRFRDEPPMVCGIQVHPEMEQFALPDWERLELSEHMTILQAIAQERDSHLTEEQQAEKWATNLQAIKNGKASLWRAHFDISNSGREVTVLRHDLWGCSPDNELNYADARLPGLAVLSEDGSRLHEDYAALHKGSRSYVEAFFHDGRTYFSRWWGDLDFENGRLMVYDTFWNRGSFGYPYRSLCTISYSSNNTQR